MNNKNNDIAVIGISGRFPEADNPGEFWKNLVSGKDSIRSLPVERKTELEEVTGMPFDKEYIKGGYLNTVTYFEPPYFSISEEESRNMDPQHRLALELVEEALQDAGYNPEALSGENVGVFMASSENKYGKFIDSPAMEVVNSLISAIAGRVSYTFNFCGPSIALDTACSSSLAALHYACLSLLNDECDYAVTGGVKIELLPPGKELLEDSPITSKRQCLSAFDKKADGTLGGEGGGILVLKKLENALEDNDTVHAVIKGTGVNSDGRRSNGMSVPNQDAQAELIKKVIKKSKIDPTSISYMEAHGTGTELGDPVEVEGMTKAFREYTDKKQFIPIGSVKTNIGHLDPAAGTAGLIKVILSLKNKKIPPSLHFDEPNPYIDFKNSPVFVNDKLIDWKAEGPRRAGIMSLGLIGTNVFAVIEEAPVPVIDAMESGSAGKGKNIFTLSARTGNSLGRMVHNLKEFLKQNPPLSPGDIAYTLNTGRRHLPYRFSVVAGSVAELIEKLESFRESAPQGKTNGSPVFVYPALSTEPLPPMEALFSVKVFKEHYDRCIRLFEKNDAHRQFFAYQYAYSMLMISCGIKPKAVFGMGPGKCAADVVKGSRSLEEGVRDYNALKSMNEPIDEGKLKEVIQTMQKKNYDLFLLFGENRLLERVIAPYKQDLLYILLTPASSYRWYSALCELYKKGFPIEWEGLYRGQVCRRVSLPVYSFDRKPYFLGMESLLPASRSAEEKPPPKVETADAADVTFDDLLSIFKSYIPYQDEFDINADFFVLGGDSISVMEISDVLKEDYGVSVPMDLFYSVPSIRELIEKVLQQIQGRGVENTGTDKTNTESTSDTVETVDEDEEAEILRGLNNNLRLSELLAQNKVTREYPVSSLQKSSLTTREHDALAASIVFVSYDFHMPESAGTSLTSTGTPGEIERVLRVLVNENALLRSIIVKSGENYFIREFDSFSNIELSYIDISGYSAPARKVHFTAVVSKLFEPFEKLDGRLLYRPVVLKWDQHLYKIVFSFNHLISDGGSQKALVNKIDEIRGRKAPGPVKPGIDFYDYCKFFENLDYRDIRLDEYLDVEEYKRSIDAACENYTKMDFFKNDKNDEFEIDISTLKEDVKNKYNEIALLAYARLIKDMFRIDNVPIIDLYHGRHYKDGNFSLVLGDLHDYIPLLIRLGDSENHLELMDRYPDFKKYIFNKNLNLVDYAKKHGGAQSNVSELASPFSFNSQVAEYDDPDLKDVTIDEENSAERREARESRRFLLGMTREPHSNRLFMNFYQNSQFENKELRERFMEHFHHLVDEIKEI